MAIIKIPGIGILDRTETSDGASYKLLKVEEKKSVIVAVRGRIADLIRAFARMIDSQPESI